MDAVVIMALVIMCVDHYALKQFDVFELTIVCAAYFVLMIPLQLWMY